MPTPSYETSAVQLRINHLDGSNWSWASAITVKSLQHNSRHLSVNHRRIVKRADGSDWELGTGNFGKVLRGMRGEVQPVAVKSMFRRDRAMEEAFIREIAMMKCARLEPSTCFVRCLMCFLLSCCDRAMEEAFIREIAMMKCVSDGFEIHPHAFSWTCLAEKRGRQLFRDFVGLILGPGALLGQRCVATPQDCFCLP